MTNPERRSQICRTNPGAGSRLARALAIIACIAICLAPLAHAAAPATPQENRLSFEDRIHCQRRIEEVYWQHRIWPAENPNPKPELDDLLPEGQLRNRVTTYLQESAALEMIWRRPLTGRQLQAELDRMVRDTRDAELLQELLAALDHDPFLAAECLARPALAKRLTRSWYKRDSRFHGTLRAQAESARTKLLQDAVPMRDLGVEYAEIDLRLVDEGRPLAADDAAPTDSRPVELTAEQWRERIVRLAGSFGIDRDAGAVDDPSALLDRIPLGRVSLLVEEDHEFVLSSVLSVGPDHLRTASLHWRKRSFDEWWLAEGRASAPSAAGSQAIAPPAAGYALRSPRDSGCTVETWRRMWWAPTGRDRHTAVWTGSEMIVWGGYDGRYVSTGGRYDPATDTWTATSVGAGLPLARGYHTAVWTGTEMIVWGGYTGTAGAVQNTGARYDPVTDSWTATSTGAGVPLGRTNHTAVWTGTEMIVWGGLDWPADVTLNTGGRYDPTTDSWTATSTGAGVPAATYRHGAVWTGSRMIVWGGTDSDDNFFNSGGRYDPVTDSWIATSTGTGVPSPRRDPTTVWTGTEMIVWGGFDGVQTVYSGGRYDPLSDSWAEMSSGAGAPQTTSRTSAVWTGTEMILWGSGEGGRYDPSTDSWTATADGGGEPPPRWGHTGVWTGTEMIVWGGYWSQADISYQDSGGRYDPTTDSWVPTSRNLGRNEPGAVWTGAEMIVWGGYDAGWHTVDTGGRFDPAVATWAETSRGVGSPEARFEHATVWTGTEMIVWGGYDSHNFGFRNSGGRYDPAADTWTPTSMSDVPAPKAEFSSVWTGTEMIVWGGKEQNYSGTNTGGRYDPVTDRWSRTSTGAGVPWLRSGHTAVWTGAEMIVWGGGPFSDTGGRYDPVSDSWRATSTGENVPTGRSDHHAVWTGSEMIVWGGSNSSGARYDPASDSWSPMSWGTGTAFAFPGQTVLWTGAEMIIWGGGSWSDPQNIGARYDPMADTWTATAVGADLPQGRTGHAAVWNGREMIIWGGKTSDYWTINPADLYCVCDEGSVQAWYPDADGDGFGSPTTGVLNCEQPPGYVVNGDDCDDRYASCTTDCIDADADGIPSCAPDCDDSNPNCSTDCTDVDADAYCVNHDCDDSVPSCTADCGDADDDGYRDCDADCDSTNPYCHADCTDADADQYCIGVDCDETNPQCTSDCTDADGDDYCVTTDCDDTIASCNIDCTSDTDNDFAPECQDNCPGIYNPFQIDADHDGWGEAAGCDCDGTNADTHPGAPETNDGLDNQCPGDAGHGVVDEISGVCGFHNPANENEFSWTAQEGATGYQVARSADPLFTTGCLLTLTTDAFWVDFDSVPEGACQHYLVRPSTPNSGSWGEDSQGTERTSICP